MGFFARLFGRSENSDEKRFVEAAGASYVDEDEGWRKLSGDADRDLSPLTQARIQKMAAYLWERNLLANRMIELPLAYLLAKGVTLTVKDDQAQQILDEHWNDGLNNWDMKLPKKLRELSLFGEQCWPAFRDERSGFVRWGYLDPSLIDKVIKDPENVEQPIGIVTKRDKKGKYRRYRIICNVPEEAFSDRAQAIRAEFIDGDCLYFPINDLCAGGRGRSDLTAAADWLDAYDQFLFGEIDRSQFLRAFVWDITLTGASEEECRSKAKSIGTPTPGSVRVHNESETWKAESPDLKTVDSEAAAKLFRNHLLGGATIPEHWYGGAGDVNRSTGQSMHEPTEKMLEMRQRFVGHMLMCVGTYVLRSHWRALDREFNAQEREILNTLQCEWPEMSAKDISRYAAALQQIIVAAIAAINEGLVSKETALKIVQKMAAEIGVPFDVDEELLDAAMEMSKRQEEDTYTPDPAALDDDDEQ